MDRNLSTHVIKIALSNLEHVSTFTERCYSTLSSSCTERRQQQQQQQPTRHIIFGVIV